LQGQQNLYFGVSKVAVWMLNGLYQSLVCFVFVYLLYRIWPERRNGHMVGLFGAGTTLYTVVVICVNCQIAVVSSALCRYWVTVYFTSPTSASSWSLLSIHTHISSRSRASSHHSLPCTLSTDHPRFMFATRPILDLALSLGDLGLRCSIVMLVTAIITPAHFPLLARF
jgi:magnesium-transporting ATPase (P-type)